MENTNEKQKCSGKGAVICGIIIGAVAAVMMIWMAIALSGINSKLAFQNRALENQNILVQNQSIKEISFKSVDTTTNEECISTYKSSSSEGMYSVTIYENGYVLLKKYDGSYVNLFYLPPESVLYIENN